MKWLYGIGALLLALSAWLFQPSWHRYRLTLVVETPEGVRQASGVLQSIFTYNYGANGTLTQCSMRGEAVFLEIPGGRNLVMLLTHGLRGDSVNLMCQLPARVLLGPEPTYGPGPYDRFYKSWPLRWLSGSAVLPLEMIPTFVTFTDLASPASAQVIYATGPRMVCNRPDPDPRNPSGCSQFGVAGTQVLDNFAEAFGPGYGLKEVRVEMVWRGLWPFNLLPIPFLQPLFGTPITTGIEAKMPWWDKPERPAARALRSAGLTTGASIDAESAFVRH